MKVPTRSPSSRPSVRSATMSFFVDPREGHDDFVMSLALCVRAAARLQPEPISVMIPPRPLFEDRWAAGGRY